ncbi:MAG: quinone-dependent dihydroorotate dehydrogenase [Alphaproteobacteria bacterium]|nr:quinone-dependent dihydroorotate dehydrogenase [Alphaproteobacteria bacterium]
MSVHDLAARALRTVDPERAHRLALLGLKAGLGPRTDSAAWPILRTTLAGIELPNPLGLAAGFDKDAEAPDAMLRAGFGLVECGTVTPLAQSGNPRPRLFRLLPDAAVINRMGFNNRGLDVFVARLRARAHRPGVVGANIGANKDSPDRLADYERGFCAVYQHAAYVVVNVSSPNTPGLRGLQERDALDALLSRLAVVRTPLAAAHGRRPLFLKVAPDLDEPAVVEIADLVAGHGFEGIIVSNTTIARPLSLKSRHRGEAGGLSGRPLFAPSTEILRQFATALNGRATLIGVGGVSSGAEALAKIKAGASAVQLYSALALQGPGLIAQILANLAARLEAEGFASVSEAVGADLA